MEKKFDLSSMLKELNYEYCDILVATDDIYAADSDWEVVQDDDLCDMLLRPDAEGAEYIRTHYKHIAWDYSYYYIPQLRIEYGVEDDSLFFYYDKLDFKTKYSLVNIMKSQHDWTRVGIVIIDSNEKEVLEVDWFDERSTKNDLWMVRFEEMCNEHVVNSCHAALRKVQEEENGKKVDVLNIVIDTYTQPKTQNDDEE